jgi:uncharacterized protein (TIGR02391 family)
MESILDQLIVEGKRLLQRVRLHYSTSPDTLPPEQQVTVAELEAWYKGVEAVLEKTFGADSAELRQWIDGRAESRRRSWDAVFGRDAPQGESFAVQLLAESIGGLAEIRLSRLKPQQGGGDAIGFGSLHPKVAEPARGLFAAGEYDYAVFAAFKAVEEELRRRIHADPSELGVNLVSKAMSPKAPLLHFSNIPSEQEAVHSLFRGAVGAFKNPLSHRSVNYSDPARVLESLAFASLLMRLLDDLAEVH